MSYLYDHSTPANITVIPDFNASEWHTYGFEWTEKAVTFYVDGKITHVADYPITQFEHDNLNIWITAIAANWTVKTKKIARQSTIMCGFIQNKN